MMALTKGRKRRTSAAKATASQLPEVENIDAPRYA